MQLMNKLENKAMTLEGQDMTHSLASKTSQMNKFRETIYQRLKKTINRCESLKCAGIPKGRSKEIEVN
jgi:hypothetical protein